MNQIAVLIGSLDKKHQLVLTERQEEGPPTEGVAEVPLEVIRDKITNKDTLNGKTTPTETPEAEAGAGGEALAGETFITTMEGPKIIITILMRKLIIGSLTNWRCQHQLVEGHTPAEGAKG